MTPHLEIWIETARAARIFWRNPLILTLVLFLFSLFAVPARAEQNAQPVVSRIVVDVKSAQDREREKLSHMAKNLIYLKTGEPFSERGLTESLQALKLCGKFSEIHADTQEATEGMTVMFELKPFSFIKNIVITGEYPLFEQKVLSALTVYTGDAYVEEPISRQAALVEKLYREEGFLEPVVDISSIRDPDDDNFKLQIDIQAGKYLFVSDIVFEGNRNFSDSRLKARMRTWRMSLFPGSTGRFIQKRLEKDVDSLTRFYRKKQYPDATVKADVEKNLQTHEALVRITVTEGDRYDIQFSGNEHFWDRTLRKDLVLFEKGNFNNVGLRRSARKIRERYQEAGFLDARVQIEQSADTVQNFRVQKIKLIITEGSQTLVDNIAFTGNEFFSDDRLKKQMLTRPPELFHSGAYVPEVLGADMNAIKTAYAQEGFTETKIESETHFSDDKRKVDVTVKIDEGPRTLVESVSFSSLSVLDENEALGLIDLTPGSPFRKYMIKSDENSLSSRISPKGYPHVSVKGETTFNEDLTGAKLHYTVNEGPFSKMGEMYYSGNFRTKDYIIDREVEMEPGEPFSLEKMLMGQRAIRNLEIFDSVRFKTIGLKEKAEDIHLFAELEEKKPYYFSTSIGYSSDIGMYAKVKGGDKNFLGRNKEVWAGGSVSQIGHRAEGWFIEPRLLGSRIGANFGIYHEKKEEFNQDFGVEVLGASMGFDRKLPHNLATGLSVRYENRDLFDVDGNEMEAVDMNDDRNRPRQLVVTTPSITYDTRDSAIRPRKGIYSFLSTDISKGLDSDFDSFVKYNLDTRFYYTPKPLKWLTIACLARAGYIDPYGNISDIPEDQLFFLGGTADVRGFDENMLAYDNNNDPVGGKASMAASLETRIDLGNNFELALFLDAGRISETQANTDFDDIRTSAGAGIRYITPIGPVGFLYGFKLDKKEDESSGRLHFSIGYTF